MAQADVLFRIEAQMGDTLAQLRKLEDQIDSLPPKQKAVAGATDATAGSMRGLVSALGPVAGAIAGAFSVGAIVSFGRASVMAAAEAEDSIGRVRSALAATGNAGLTGQLADLAGQLQATTRYSDDAIMAMQAMALRIGVPAAQMDDFTRAAVDMAAALQMDVVDAGEQLAKTLDGDAGRLSQSIAELGNLDESALKAGRAIDVVAAKFSSAATEDAQTLGGSLAQLTNAWGEVQEAVGGAIGELGNVSGASNGLASALTGTAVPAINEWKQGWILAFEAMRDAKSELSDIVAKVPGASSALSAMGDGLKSVFLPFSKGGIFSQLFERIGAGGALPDLSGAKFGSDTAKVEATNNALSKQREIQEHINRSQKENEDLRAAAAEKAKKAAEAAAEQERKQREEVEKRVEAFDNAAGRAEQQLATLKTMAVTDEQRKQFTEQIASELERSVAAGFSLVEIGAISKEHFAGIAENAAAAAASVESFAAIGGGPMDFMDIKVADTTTGDGTGQSQYEQDAILRDQQREAFEEQMSRFDSMQQAIEQQRASWAMLSAEQQNQVKQTAAQTGKMQALRGTTSMMTSAAGQLGAGLMQMAITGEGSFKKLMAAALTSLATEAASRAMFELAAGLAAMAWGNPAAAEHFAAAKVYGMVALAAGVGAKLAGAGSGGGGGSASGARTAGESDSTFGATSSQRDNSRTVDATRSGEQRGPSVQVVFSGNVTSAGGPQEFARIIKSELDRVASETGGRSATVRL